MPGLKPDCKCSILCAAIRRHGNEGGILDEKEVFSRIGSSVSAA